jgi:serine/threonine protein kinase
MPFPSGASLGPYRILAPLGAGGMGEVYRAHDTTLGRDVAIKILPAATTDDPDRRTRLQREARAAASLNHPNICTIHEVGEADSRVYIAMEVVDGEPLSKRLERPLPLDELVRYALQMADALAHAHERGIVHRDLKSANVLITPEGRVKILDFGLAKAVGADAVADLTTRTEFSLTQSGAIVGTLPYMAPEQLRGARADLRSDVWAFGVVLHEMAAGARPFTGTTEYELSSAILGQSLPPLPARVPAALQAIIRRCLEKEPARRYQRASELRAALETVVSQTTSRISPTGAGLRRGIRFRVLAAIVAPVAIAGAVLWFGAGAVRDRLTGVRGQQIRSIAVLPLENLSNDPEQDYFAAGIHEALITDLARIGLQKVIAKTSGTTGIGQARNAKSIERFN